MHKILHTSIEILKKKKNMHKIDSAKYPCCDWEDQDGYNIVVHCSAYQITMKCLGPDRVGEHPHNPI